MVTNTVFEEYSSESDQFLQDSLIVESIQIAGRDFYYIPRETVNVDDIFNEDTISSFKAAKVIEMYVETFNGFDGEGDILTKFGLQVNDQATLIMAKSRFHEEFRSSDRPLEGDLIYFPLTKSLFEIMFVEHEDPFLQLGKGFIYKFNVELFKYSREDFNTGIEDVDDLYAIDGIEEHIDHDPFSDNDETQVESDEIVDFTEENPFGMP